MNPTNESTHRKNNYNQELSSSHEAILLRLTDKPILLATLADIWLNRIAKEFYIYIHTQMPISILCYLDIYSQWMLHATG